VKGEVFPKNHHKLRKRREEAASFGGGGGRAHDSLVDERRAALPNFKGGKKGTILRLAAPKKREEKV